VDQPFIEVPEMRCRSVERNHNLKNRGIGTPNLRGRFGKPVECRLEWHGIAGARKNGQE